MGILQENSVVRGALLLAVTAYYNTRSIFSIHVDKNSLGRKPKKPQTNV